MTEIDVPLATRTRRPKRVRSKPSDDTILGISWKEERELRKAMYVSLRQQQSPTSIDQKESPSSMRILRLLPERMRTSTRPLPLPTRRQLEAENKLRTAKLRATACLSALLAGTMSTSKSNCRDPSSKDVQRKVFNTPIQTNKTTRKLTATHQTELAKPKNSTTLLDSSVLSAKRPTLISASNVVKSSQISRRLFLQRAREASPQSTSRRLRSPVKFSVPRPEKCSLNDPGIVRNVLRHVKNTSTSINTKSTDSPFKRVIETVPFHLCEDPQGRPVSVHDFVEYICFQGTPCLDPKLTWLDRSHLFNESTGSTPLVPTNSPLIKDTLQPNDLGTVLTDCLSSRCSPHNLTGCVAKKIATTLSPCT